MTSRKTNPLPAVVIAGALVLFSITMLILTGVEAAR